MRSTVRISVALGKTALLVYLGLLALCQIGLAAAPAAGDGGVTFSYLAPDAGEVQLAGDFNGWNTTETAMNLGDDGIWTVTLALDPGSYEYKFVVDGNWITDPDNPEKKSDPFGGSNSLVTVNSDGSVGGSTSSTPGTTPAAPAATVSAADVTVGPPAAVKDGIRFSFREPGVGNVNLAGTFNGWNATELAMTSDGDGNWTITHKLDAGEHEYKFVVDGNWITDPENPDTKPDPYGGANSLVIVDAKGQLVAAAAAAADLGTGPVARPTSNTSLNPKIFLSGRYLTRFELAKNIFSDPRYRLLRPSMSADLNFETKVSDLVDSYMRIRMDSNENVILNNINGFLDEAYLQVHPDKFNIKAYWNQEIFSSADVLKLVGDIDHPATIGHDHLDFGKGTAGALIEADPFGVHFQAFFANVHNYDYYNDPRLFDNTGGDKIWLRLSRDLGPVTLGLPLWFQRELLWLDFEGLVGLPSTGIPSLDEHLEQTGDSSLWFETEAHLYTTGLDASLPLDDDRLVLSGQYMMVDRLERFVTGNQSGQNNVNGAIDVPFLERDEKMAGVQLDWNPDLEKTAYLKHTLRSSSGADPDERTLLIGFIDQAIAENHIFFAIGDSPAQVDEQLTEFEGSWRRDDLELGWYLYRYGTDHDFGVVGATVPGDTLRTSLSQESWYVSGLVGKGTPKGSLGHAELEFGLKLTDPDLPDQDLRTFEVIGRYERSVSRNVAVIGDVRYISYDLDLTDSMTGGVVSRKEDYWNPFVGLKYQPARNLELVVGFGQDPVEFSIDYAGREFGRWWYRQRFLFDNPLADLLDAEQALHDARIFTLRGQMTF